MPDQKKPWWYDQQVKQQEVDRENMKMLIKTAPTYFQPPRDHGIIYKPRDSRIAVEEQSTGDFMISHGQRDFIDLHFTTKSGKLVRIFGAQFGSRVVVDGISLSPIAVYEILNSKFEDSDVIEARKRMSFKRLAEYMTAYPDFANYPDNKFVIIDATGQSGEGIRALRGLL